MRTKITLGALTSLLSFMLLTVPNLVAADQGFFVIDKSVRPGMLMNVSSSDSNVAEPAVAERAESLIGILGDEPTSFDIQDGQLNVLTGGVRNTLVTTINGDIKNGDYITATSLVGLGGKLLGSGWVVGIAQADLGAEAAGAVKSSVMDSSGQTREVYVGSIPVLIKVLYHDDTASIKERDVSFIPEKLQKTLDSIAGRRASQIAILLAILLLLAGFFIGGLIANSAIKNGITSTARQPLAKQVITQRMIQSCLLALCIVILSVVGALVLIRVL